MALCALCAVILARIPVPNTNNTAGINWRTVVVNSGRNVSALKSGDGTAGTISTTEAAQIAAGSVLEVSDTLRIGSVPAGGMGSYLDAEYLVIKNRAIDRLAVELALWGGVR